MNIVNKIKENRKSIVVIAVLLFNIPLAFGLVSNVQAQLVRGGTIQSITNSPSSQNFFHIQDSETSKATVNCRGNLGIGVSMDFAKTGSKVLTGKEWQTTACVVQTSTPEDLVQYFNNNGGGILGGVNNIQAVILEQRPLSTSYYIDQKVYALQNNGVVHAQGADPAPYFPAGTGFQLLSPIQAFWGWSVNIVYGILILIIIGIAFAIVFRNNLGGAQVVTIQSAIPSIALAMILVPLSYAISGVFIDAITVGSNVVHSFLLGPGAPGREVYVQRNDGRINPQDCINQGGNQTTDDPCDRGLYADDSRVNWFNVQKMVDISDEVEAAAQEIPDPLNPNGGSILNDWFIFKLVQSLLDLFTGQANSPAYWFGEIINVVIGITMIWIGLKILWKLFQKYLMLILMPIISPFIFATAAVPGNGTKSIVEYIKMMGSGSLAYIVTYAMFLLTIIFTSSAFQSQIPEIKSGAFVPPLLGLSDIFTQGAGSTPLTHFIFTLVGLGIYFSIPSVLQQIDDALGVKNAIPAFIMTPIDSFRESARMTYRAAPAFGARGIQSTARAGFRGAQTATNAGFNVRRAYDRARGFEDDDPRSATFQRRQSNINRRQDLLARLDASENPVERAGLQAQLARLNATEAFQGKEFSSKVEEGKTRSIKTTINYKAGSGAYQFNTARIREIETQFFGPGGAAAGVLIPGPAHEESIGLLSIESENLSLSPFEDVYFGNTEKYRGIDIYKDDQFPRWDITSQIFGRADAASPTGFIDFFELDDKTVIAGPGGPVPLGTIRIRAGVGNQTQETEDNKKINIPLKIFIDRNVNTFRELFGTWDPTTNKYVGGRLQYTIQTDKRAVKVKGVKGQGFRLKVSRV